MLDNDAIKILLGVHGAPFLAAFRESNATDAILDLHEQINKPEGVAPEQMEEFTEWVRENGILVVFNTREALIGMVQGLLACDKHMEAMGQTLPPIEAANDELGQAETAGNA